MSEPRECAICYEPTGKGDFEYTVTSKDHRRLRFYAYVHDGECDQAFTRTALGGVMTKVEAPS